MKKIPELQKLKDRIIERPNEEAEQLHAWLSAVIDVRLEEKRRTEAKLKQSTTTNNPTT